MAVYTQLANEVIARVLDEDYGLAALDFAKGIAEGVSNSNFLVVTKDGEVRHQYILTLYEKRIVREDIPFFLNLMRYLATVGIACPQPLPRKNGALVGEVAGRAAALVSFVPGHSRTEISVSDAAAMGATMGKLHLATADYKERRANALSFAGWRDIFSKIEGKLDRLEAGLAALVRDELAFLEKHWPKDLPRGVIHADLFPNNVFFMDAAVSGIIDFYFACSDFYAYDVAITHNAWCFDGESFGLRGSDLPSRAVKLGLRDSELPSCAVKFNAEKSRALLAAYEKIRSLSVAEKAAMPVLLRGAALRFLLTRAQDALFPESGSLVAMLDPLEYVAKLRFHRGEA